MPSKIDILQQVITSLVADQMNSMNNINALLHSKSTKLDLVPKLKSEISELSRIHGVMRETEVLILDLAQQSLNLQKTEESEEPGSPGGFGSSGTFDGGENVSEK